MVETRGGASDIASEVVSQLSDLPAAIEQIVLAPKTEQAALDGLNTRFTGSNANCLFE